MEGLPGPLSAGGAPAPPRWWSAEPRPGRRTIRTHAELWRLHSALHAGRFSPLEDAPALGLAVISGLPGTGKTTLAERYALDFGAAFPGGVYRFSLDDGAEGADALLGYRRMLREMASDEGIPVEGVADDRLRFRIARHLGRRARPVLWIVDRIPEGAPDEIVGELPVPSRSVHTILIGRENRGGPGVSVPLAGLADAEGLALLEGAYGDGEEPDALAVVRLLGGHPYDLQVARAALRETRGLAPVSAYLGRIAGDAAVVAEPLRRLDPAALTVLGLASVLAPAPIPRALLVRAVALWHGWPLPEAGERLAPALRSLIRSCVVIPAGDAVAVHSRVLRALPPGAAEGCLHAAGAAVASGSRSGAPWNARSRSTRGTWPPGNCPTTSPSPCCGGSWTPTGGPRTTCPPGGSANAW
ncbi:TIR protein [Planomonospora sphaerica]|uniref:TIR protein n=1 Tax=Planomonospora sphaerica TaxID=161355 RepID=A0A171CH18_9ACTN|nr:ATP-binding protein [Planomonospora sphaerica]GAT66691.1 TIR protein [Planomonospora sphaerica]